MNNQALFYFTHKQNNCLQIELEKLERPRSEIPPHRLKLNLT